MIGKSLLSLSYLHGRRNQQRRILFWDNHLAVNDSFYETKQMKSSAGNRGALCCEHYMYDTYATRISTLEKCDDVSMSFFSEIDTLSERLKPNRKCAFNSAPLHRLCTLMRKMKAKAVLRENLRENDELKAEREMAAARTGKKVTLKATRWTFFCTYPENGDWMDQKNLPDDHILGYAVLVTLTINGGFKRSYILEAVVRPPSVIIPFSGARDPSLLVVPITNCYVHNSREFRTTVGVKTKCREFRFEGTFFAQQNDLTHVCAHAALRTSVNSSPEFGNTKLTNKMINQTLGIDFSSESKSVGHFPGDGSNTKTGLRPDEIIKVAASLGGTVHIAHFSQNADIEYDQYIYPVLESGFPVILGIEGWDVRCGRAVAHAVAVLGHTLDSDRWSPQARSGYGSFPLEPYLPVTAWCDHYVVSDDNYGMHVTLPADMIRNFIVPSKNPNLHAMVAITLLPNSVNLRGYAAEQYAMSLATRILNVAQLSPPPKWFKFMKAAVGKLTCRTVLCSGERYRNHLKGIAQDRGIKIPPKHWRRLCKLPEDLWVSEISIPDIYDGNKHKLGDIVINANSSDEECMKGNIWVLAWFPGMVVYQANNLIDTTWFLDTHVPFLRDGAPPPLEW